MSTIDDVARAAGISKSTVSRFSSGNGYVPNRAGGLVQGAMERLNYYPNKFAQGLAGNRADGIGVVIQNFAEPYFGVVLRGIEGATREHNLQITVASGNRSPHDELEAIIFLRQQRYNVIVLTTSVLPGSRLLEELKQGTQLVHIGHRLPQLAERCVYLDDARGADLATSYLISRTRFWTFFGNSMVVSVTAVLIGVVLSALAGYAMSRYRGLVVGSYSRLLLIIQMFPLIPLFILFRNLSLINHPLSVILIYAVVNLPFATWMFKSFFDSIPRELEEAAAVDGCTKLQGFVRVVLPLAGPGTAAVAIFAFLLSFNEFFIANVFLRSETSMTLPVGIQIFTQQYGSDWGSLMATTLTMLPTFVLFLFVQKYMLYGSVGAGVKG